MIEIRRAIASDWESIWPLFQAVIAEGDSFVYPPDTTEEEAFEIWMSSPASTYVALEGGGVVGSYLLKANQPGLGSHVANAAYMVRPDRVGKGIGRAMGEHSLREAKAAGYAAMQFNIVVSSNERAVSLWKALGFRTIGTIPHAFRHKRRGLVDAYIMHRFLDE
jgi:ribosomal protein S18 acetylase RimI-like enzyme